VGCAAGAKVGCAAGAWVGVAARAQAASAKDNTIITDIRREICFMRFSPWGFEIDDLRFVIGDLSLIISNLTSCNQEDIETACSGMGVFDSNQVPGTQPRIPTTGLQFDSTSSIL
jgi:hypothetical protein